MTARHLLTLADLEPSEFWGYIATAEKIKASPLEYHRALYAKTLLMIFQAPSLRTRLSFETGMTQMGGHGINYETANSPWGKGKESIEDVAKVLSRYCDVVSARIYSQEDLVALAENATVPVVNAMTNDGHPCQILGDFLTLKEHLGNAEGLRLAYVGDACNNVTYSWMRAAALTGGELRIGCPEGADFSPDPAIIEQVNKMCERFGGKVQITHDAKEAAEGAQMVYADSWMSYRIPEEEKAARYKALRPYQVTGELMKLADPNCKFMHCLPATRGDEVTAEVIDGPQSIVFDEAENRLHIEKAILLSLVGGVD